MRMINDDSLSGWTKDSQDAEGAILTHDALVIAAGQCPVISDGNQVHFPGEAFLTGVPGWKTSE
jgi:hypothetical protein